MELTGHGRWRAELAGRRPPEFRVDTAAAGGRHLSGTRAAGSSLPSR